MTAAGDRIDENLKGLRYSLTTLGYDVGYDPDEHPADYHPEPSPHRPASKRRTAMRPALSAGQLASVTELRTPARRRS